MNRGSNFLIGLVAAIITFGALTLTLGPKHAVWGRHHHGWHGARHHDNHNDHACIDEGHQKQNEKHPEQGAE